MISISHRTHVVVLRVSFHFVSPVSRVTVITGSLSNDDADGNENGKKAIG